MAFKRHFARVGAAERCTESIFTDHQRQVCDYALVYAEKKNDGDAPYSVSFTAEESFSREVSWINLRGHNTQRGERNCAERQEKP